MFGLGKPKQVAEYEAEGETERVYHEIKQTLRVTGINLNFRTWAGYEKFFPAMWDAMRPVVETRDFQDAADRVRAEAVRAACDLGRLALDTNLTIEITVLLPKIEAPTLVLWGVDDVFQLVKYGERLAWDIPGAQFVRVKGARHFVMLDQPDLVAEHVSAFLRGERAGIAHAG